jgi:hypothetical protein
LLWLLIRMAGDVTCDGGINDEGGIEMEENVIWNRFYYEKETILDVLVTCFDFLFGKR